MTHRMLLLGSIVVAGACASSPRGPSDAELAQQLQQRWEAAIPAPAMRAALFAPDGRMTISGLPGPDGAPSTIDLVGIDQIRPFVTETPPSPGFAMEFLNFERAGSQLTQTGRWRMTGYAGPFTLMWRETGGVWRVTLLRMQATKATDE
jgi:hypothetical protein